MSVPHSASSAAPPSPSQQPHLIRPLSSSPEESESESETMAKLMGFSDFGSKPKKRKIDYQQEAQMLVVTAESRFAKGSGNGSGENAMPLGRRKDRKKGESKGGEGESRGQVEADGRTNVEGAVGDGGALREGSSKKPFQSLRLGNASKGPEGGEEENLGGFRSQTGLEGYFHPSFIEDPWEKLR